MYFRKKYLNQIISVYVLDITLAFLKEKLFWDKVVFSYLKEIAPSYGILFTKLA